MKKSILLIGLGLIISLTSNSQQPEFEYFKNISEVYKPISRDSWDYMKSVAKGRSARKIDNKRQDLINTIREAKGKVMRIRGRDGDFGLKDSTLSYLTTTLYVFKDEYDKIIDMEAIAEESYDAMEAYILTRERANDKTENKFNNLQFAAQQYAAENNINLVEDDSRLAEKRKKAGAAMDYYNEAYLIFYKCNFYEAKLIKELSAGDVSAASQTSNALKQYVDEGEEKLTELSDYEGDGSLRVAIKVILNFYKEEVSNDIPNQIDYFVFREDFDQMKLEFEALKKKDRTKEVVDKYNGMINEYNERVNQFNETNERLNKERSNQLNKYQKGVDKFFAANAF